MANQHESVAKEQGLLREAGRRYLVRGLRPALRGVPLLGTPVEKIPGDAPASLGCHHAGRYDAGTA